MSRHIPDTRKGEQRTETGSQSPSLGFTIVMGEKLGVEARAFGVRGMERGEIEIELAVSGFEIS